MASQAPRNSITSSAIRTHRDETVMSTQPTQASDPSRTSANRLPEPASPDKSAPLLKRSTITCPSLSAVTWLSAGLAAGALIVAVYYGLPMLRLVKWTAVKDFRESCISDRAIGVTSLACNVSLAEPIQPPPIVKRAATMEPSIAWRILPSLISAFANLVVGSPICFQSYIKLTRESHLAQHVRSKYRRLASESHTRKEQLKDPSHHLMDLCYASGLIDFVGRKRAMTSGSESNIYSSGTFRTVRLAGQLYKHTKEVQVLLYRREKLVQEADFLFGSSKPHLHVLLDHDAKFMGYSMKVLQSCEELLLDLGNAAGMVPHYLMSVGPLQTYSLITVNLHWELKPSIVLHSYVMREDLLPGLKASCARLSSATQEPHIAAAQAHGSTTYASIDKLSTGSAGATWAELQSDTSSKTVFGFAGEAEGRRFATRYMGDASGFERDVRVARRRGPRHKAWEE